MYGTSLTECDATMTMVYMIVLLPSLEMRALHDLDIFVTKSFNNIGMIYKSG